MVVQLTRKSSAETSRKDPNYAFAKNTTRDVTDTPFGRIEVETSSSVSNSKAILAATILKDGLPYYSKNWHAQTESRAD